MRQQTTSTEGKKLIQAILYFWGLVILAVGAFCILNPAALQNMFGFDEFTTMVLGIAMMAAGFGDFLFARFFFQGKDPL